MCWCFAPSSKWLLPILASLSQGFSDCSSLLADSSRKQAPTVAMVWKACRVDYRPHIDCWKWFTIHDGLHCQKGRRGDMGKTTKRKQSSNCSSGDTEACQSVSKCVSEWNASWQPKFSGGFERKHGTTKRLIVFLQQNPAAFSGFGMGVCMCARSNEHACTSRCQNKRSFFGTAANKAGYQDFFRPLSFARVYANDNSLPSPEGEESLSAKELHRWKHSAQQLTTWTREGGRVRELEMIFDDASYKIMVCWNSGGRYWYLETDVTSSTACVPSECSADDVETHIARMFFAKLAAPGVHLQIVTTREVFHWGQLELDFAIIGMDGCGSTSVHRILSQHTEIQFTNLSVFNVDEDFFMVELGRQTLPFRSQVERLNRFRMEVRQKSGDSKVVGLYQPFMWNIELLRLAMKQMPNMRVVCTVCDPVDRFERRMYGQSKPSDHELAEAVRKQLEDDASVTGW